MELEPSANSVCIDVDTFYISDDNDEKEFTKEVLQADYSTIKDIRYKCNNKANQKLQNYIQQSFCSSAEKRHKFANSSPKANLKEQPIEEDIPLRSKQSKGSIHFETGDPNLEFDQDKSMLKENNHQHYVPRKSLLGKPVVSRNYARQDAQYRKLQSKIYNFLERPKNWQAVSYHIMVFASVFTCLVLSVLSTIEDIGESAGEVLFYVELSVLFWFFTEYCMRLWSAGCRSRYQTWRGRLLFAKQPFCLVDLIVILASIVGLALGSDRQMFATSALRGLRFFQILRMIRMDRRGGSWKLLASVVWAHRQELFTTIYIGFLVLVFSSFLIYLVEKDEKDKIKSYADALWWGVITLCTVGYGDTVPKTAWGKLIAGCCALAGISFFALPAGILGSGFALKVQQHQRHKHLIRRRMPAANLIQCLWRCYSSDPQSSSVATWKPHLKSFRASTVEKPAASFETSIFSSISAVDKIAKFSRLSTIKRRCEKFTSSNQSANSTKSLTHSLSSSNLNLNRNNSNNDNEMPDEEAEDEDQFDFSQIATPAFPISRRNALAQSADKSREEDFSVKKKFGILDDFFLNRYTSVASMTRDETDEWESMFAKRELTMKEKNAIRFVRKVKFFVASRKFKEALRPYDLKDIIEQYSAGHVDMLGRIKCLQARLDNLFGRSNVKDSQTYDSRISLVSRIVKIETKVENIELKLDKLIQMYKQIHFPNQNLSSNQNTPHSGYLRRYNPEIVPHPSSPLLFHRPATVGFVDNDRRPTENTRTFSKQQANELHTIHDSSYTSLNCIDDIKKKVDEV